MKISHIFPVILFTACGAPEPLAKLQAQISFSPAEVDFQPASLLQNQTADLTVVNAGTAPLNISQINLVDPSGSFLLSTTQLTVAPNSQAVVHISFTPSHTGQVVADLQLVYDIEPGNSIIALSGAGLAPQQQVGEGEGEQNAGEGETEPSGPQTCQTQNDCGPNINGRFCAPDHFCHEVCRQDTLCGSGNACRPLPGSVSLGFCNVAGTIGEGNACSDSNQCAKGFCSEDGTCRTLCQNDSTCSGNTECGIAFYNSPLGRRMTTGCMDASSGKALVSESCMADQNTADSSICLTGSCNMLPWAYGLTAQANCTQICSNSGDCGANQVCGLVYTGELENPSIRSTADGPGRYVEALLGCYTPVDFTSWDASVLPPGNGLMGSSCDATSADGDLSCRSYLCAAFAPIEGRCTDFCTKDLDCNSPETPGWKCQVAELNHTSEFLQAAIVSDASKFSLVGVCSP